MMRRCREGVEKGKERGGHCKHSQLLFRFGLLELAYRFSVVLLYHGSIFMDGMGRIWEGYLFGLNLEWDYGRERGGKADAKGGTAKVALT